MDDIELLNQFARAPLRTLRLKNIVQDRQNTWRAVDRLRARGVLTRLHAGTYTAPPNGRDGRFWKPTLEVAALAIATARFGDRQAILMGVGAARHLGAYPRAVNSVTVAVPQNHTSTRVLTTSIGGYVRFTPRNLERLDATIENTELGPALVTTPAQTMFDLLRTGDRSKRSSMQEQVIERLRLRVSAGDLKMLSARRMPKAVRDIIKQMESEADAKFG